MTKSKQKVKSSLWKALHASGGIVFICKGEEKKWGLWISEEEVNEIVSCFNDLESNRYEKQIPPAH